MKILKRFKRNVCKHEFDSDGSPCKHCNKTIVELLEESKQ